MRFYSSFIALASLLAASPALAFSPFCPHYGGHVDVEGKLGGRRDLGETSVFVPVACSQDALLFSDLRFRADNQSNREGNIGLGVRVLKDTGVAGGYAYFDRKRSGVTDQYHSQVTVGAEWLAQDWEVRANGYAPLTGDVETAAGGGGISAPFLQGTGIFAQQTAQRALREIPLYGGDAEAGFRIPDTQFWLHAGAFSFAGEDAPSLDGVRARATLQLTENIALTAEGQYDDERGRQGWVGARLTLPFGGPAQKPQGVAARMTASPVRDIDIVTQTKEVTVGADRLVPVLSAATGQAQQVVYVDNAQAVNGDGSLESPFNNLHDAQAALRAHGVLYIASGTGGTTNMQDGLTLTQTGAQVIGAGSNFVYDGGRFTVATGANYTGTLLRAAGAAPKITNLNPGGDGVTIRASDILLTGFTVENADRHGIHAFENGGGALSGLAVRNVAVTGSGEDGIRIEADGAGSSAAATLANVTAAGNKNGVRYYAGNDASVAGAVQSSLLTANAQHGVIVYDDSAAGAVDVDLGGGGQSAGNNALFGNGLEDLALDIDGATLSAQNNWWGQASGLYQAAPDGTHRPQIYYGAPIEDGLVVHLTFDNEWVDNTYAYDRSGNNNDGTLIGGLSNATLIAGEKREAFAFDGIDDRVRVTTANGIDVSDRTQLTQMLFAKNTGTGVQNILLTRVNSSFNIQVGATGRASVIFVPADQPTTPTQVLSTASPLDSTQWTHLAGTWDHGGTHGYENGIQYNQKQVATTEIRGLAPYYDIGYYNYGACPGSCAGWGATPQIDDVRIYNRALSAGEIAELHRMNTDSVVDAAFFRTAAP